MEKMNFTNNQTAFEYALYMIAASYFDKAACETKYTEKSMLLQYKEQKIDKQYQMEEICIKFMDKLEKILPENVFRQEVQVQLRKSKGKLTEILFRGKNNILSFRGIYAGKRSQIEYQILTK